MLFSVMELVVDEETPLGKVQMQDLEPLRVHGSMEGGIKGDELRSRAKERGANLGEEAALWMFRHSDQIPRELQIFHLVFTAKVRKDRNRFQYMLYLYHDGERWHLESGLMHADWDAYCRVIRRKQPEESAGE